MYHLCIICTYMKYNIISFLNYDVTQFVWNICVGYDIFLSGKITMLQQYFEQPRLQRPGKRLPAARPWFQFAANRFSRGAYVTHAHSFEVTLVLYSCHAQWMPAYPTAYTVCDTANTNGFSQNISNCSINVNVQREQLIHT